MYRSLLRAAGALAFAVVLTPSAPDAAPAPGLAYDEIVRVVIGAPPPPPGNFQADVAAVATPAPATPAPRRGFGVSLGSLASGILGGGSPGSVAGGLAQQAAANALADELERSLAGTFAGVAASAQSFLQPHLMRYAYWNGWERVDDATAQTATIRKCDLGQVVRLDLARKTYVVYDPAAEPTPAANPPRGPAARTAPAAATAPGTVAIDVSLATTALGPVTIENQSTQGYNTTTTVAMTQATGSCRNGSASIEAVQYVSALAQPTVTSCPIAPRAPLPETPQDALAPPPSGGCRPTFTAHASGPAPPTGKLALYSFVSLGANAGPTPGPGGGSVGFLTERGNIHTLDAADASRFEIPPGFAQTTP